MCRGLWTRTSTPLVRAHVPVCEGGRELHARSLRSKHLGARAPCHHSSLTDIKAQLTCLKPWLDGLPDPAALQTQVLGARSTLDTTILPALADLDSQLSTLQALVSPAAPVGAYAATLAAVAAAGPVLDDTGGGGEGLVQQMQGVVDAVDGLPGGEDKVAMAAVPKRSASSSSSK